MKSSSLLKKTLAVLAGVAAIMAINSLLSPPSDSYIRDRVVKLVSDRGSCTGEQVRAPSGVDYILTAAHCKVLEKDGSITAITEDGKRLERRIIAEDDKSDLLLLEGLPSVKGLAIADSTFSHDHTRTFTHGAGMDTWKSEGEILETIRAQIFISLLDTAEKEAACSGAKFKAQEVDMLIFKVRICLMDVMETISTAKILPGSSGGPMVNDSGELIGVASASSPTASLFVRLVDIRDFLKNY